MPGQGRRDPQFPAGGQVGKAPRVYGRPESQKADEQRYTAGCRSRQGVETGQTR